MRYNFLGNDVQYTGALSNYRLIYNNAMEVTCGGPGSDVKCTLNSRAYVLLHDLLFSDDITHYGPTDLVRRDAFTLRYERTEM